MTPFLYSIAKAFYKEYGTNLSHIAFVFPNRRAGIFFQKYLAEVANKPLFSPPILTVNDFYASLVPYQLADRTDMLFTLYENFVELTQTDESFDNFVFWGEMILNDFDDIDKYVVNAKQLFTNIKEIKDIENQFDYLSEDQIAAIRRFWVHFIPAYESYKKMEFISIWEILYPLYQRMHTLLKGEGKAYEGMIFREVAERAQARQELEIPYQQVVFVGLNVLSQSEKMVMKRLRDMGIADFYWDYDAPTFADNYNKAAYFMKENTILFPSKLTLEQETPPLPQIEVIGVSSAVGQAKYAHTILTDLLASGEIPHPQKAINTAIVLPEENMLMPLLYSIPEQIDPINVTMGYTLSNTSIAALMESIFDLQKHFRMVKGEPQFYHRKVLSLLTHRYIIASGASAVEELSGNIRKFNWIFIPTSQLHCTPLLSRLFVALQSPLQAADYLIELLEAMQQQLQPVDHESEENELHPNATMESVEVEFLYHYYITVKRLKEVVMKYDTVMSVATFFKLLSKLTASISIPFHGEPLSGLQVMGVLETRALDFENVVILSVNEGIFPVKKVANTFIPNNLRRGFGLSTTDHQDSIYAYYFYRMIYRAKRLFLLYDTRAEGMQSGEMSRYIYQLRYHYQYPLVERSLNYNIAVNDPPQIAIEKTPEVLEMLEQFKHGGERAISASALNNYINCPLQFYLQHVERFTEDEEVKESIEANTFGSIYHAVMESIYLPFKNRLVGEKEIAQLAKEDAQIQSYIERAFADHFFKIKHTQPLVGQNFLVGEVIKKYVKKTLEIDKKRAPFLYCESEQRLEVEFEINPSTTVRLKAFLDRIDLKDGRVRIVDYKTGGGSNKFTSIQQLFDSEDGKRPKAIMQVFLYAMMYAIAQKPNEIEPSIYYLRNLFGDKVDCGIAFEESPRNNTQVTDYYLFDTEFREEIAKVLSVIFDHETPFYQTPDVKHCEFCNFTNICKRM